MNNQLTWDVTFHGGDSVKVQAAELRIDAHGGAGFWTADVLVANVGPGSYRSVICEQDSK
jgi:hypothetical protein